MLPVVVFVLLTLSDLCVFVHRPVGPFVPGSRAGRGRTLDVLKDYGNQL